MISLCMIITALLPGLALTKVSMECNLTGPTGQQCYGVLGEPFMFHLPTNLPKIMLKKNETLNILDIRSNVHEKYTNRSEFFTNGTFKLNNAQKTDSGNYKLQAYGSDGLFLYDINMHLEIQAPVSKPAVSQMCLSPDLMNISCSTEGDRVEFILTLDSLLLMRIRSNSQSPCSWTTDTQSLAAGKTEHDKASVSTVAISLNGQLTGNLTCQVWNNFSKEETVIHLTHCEAFAVSPFRVAMAVRAGVVFLLLSALCLCICYVHKKTRPVTVKEGISMAE